METGLGVEKPVRQVPKLFGMFHMFGVRHHHVGRQAVREGAHFPRRAAGRGLARQRERRIAGLGNLPRQKMNIIDHLIGPDAAHMLVEAHGPERHDFLVRVRIKLGQLLKETGLDAGKLAHIIERVVGDMLLEAFKV